MVNNDNKYDMYLSNKLGQLQIDIDILSLVIGLIQCAPQKLEFNLDSFDKGKYLVSKISGGIFFLVTIFCTNK